MEVNNLTPFPLNEKIFYLTAKMVAEKENEKGEISIAFVGSPEIKELNKIYRGKDNATDVLSFSYQENRHLGEIIVCPEEVRKAVAENADFTKELLYRIIHGALHLCGYDHNKETEREIMEKKTEHYLQACQSLIKD